ncbi:MAG: S8 family peptidase [Egibacteraceae bacterium]
MRRLLLLAAALLLGPTLLPAGASAAPPTDDVIPGAYIVAVRHGNPAAVAADHRARHGAAIEHVYRYALRGYAARMSAGPAARVAADPRVASVTPDRRVSIAAQSVPTGIRRIDADLSSTRSGDGTGSVDVDVAIIDTGIDVDHPDLKVVGGVNCSTGRSFDDGNGHGTHVAGTAAAKDDSQGVVGVSPGARLYAVRVLNNRGSGSFSSIICGVDWVTARANTVEVANMSLGGSAAEGSCTDGGLHEAICKSVQAGVTYAVAAGNESDDAANHVPASYDEVITVSALADFDGEPGGLGAPTCRSDEDDTFANFSNYGADIDLIAPGVCINSTWKGGGYKTISGTSMASPHVAGAAALYLSQHPSASPSQVKTALQAAGSDDWDNRDDPDGVKEPLLNVAGF